MALNDRHLNPQLGRIVRTLGFDRRWVARRGRAPDRRPAATATSTCLSGYGVFALGRNHPAWSPRIEDVLAAETANLPQLGVSLLSGRARRGAGRAGAAESVDAMVPANSGAEAVEAAIKLARAATGRPRILYAEPRFPRAHARRAVA